MGSLLSAGIGAIGSLAGGGKGGGDGGSSGGSGSTGQLNPFLAAYTLEQNLNKIRGRYADLGLGGSTMESMDESGANLAALAQEAGLDQQSALTAASLAQTQSNIGAQNISNLSSLQNLSNQNQTLQGVGDVHGPGGTGTSGTGTGGTGSGGSGPNFP